MAYSAIADSEIDPESPGTTTLFTKLRDNPEAMMLKLAGATVLANDYIVNAMIKNGEVGISKLPTVTVGNYLEGTIAYRTGADIGDPTASYTKILEIKSTRAGTYTVRHGLAETNTAYNVRIKIYVNGSAVGTERNPSTVTNDDWFWFNENITIAEGDLVQLYAHRGGSSAERAAMCIALLCANPIATGADYNDIHQLNKVNGHLFDAT